MSISKDLESHIEMPITDIGEFKHKYGAKGVSDIIGEFIFLCPEFPEETRKRGDELIRYLGVLTNDLEFALRDIRAYRR